METYRCYVRLCVHMGAILILMILALHWVSRTHGAHVEPTYFGQETFVALENERTVA